MRETPKSTVIANKKKELYDKSDQLRSAMTTDIDKLRIDIGRIGKNFLIIGGSLYAAYKLTKLFTRPSSPKREEPVQQVVQTRESSAMATRIKEQIALFLLALAFNKLKEFVKEHSGHENEQEDS